MVINEINKSVITTVTSIYYSRSAYNCLRWVSQSAIAIISWKEYFPILTSSKMGITRKLL